MYYKIMDSSADVSAGRPTHIHSAWWFSNESLQFDIHVSLDIITFQTSVYP